MKSDKKNKPLACVSLDLDNQWSYMKIHGDEGWDEYPSYFDIFVPHVLDLLDELGLRITFFIVGKDTEREENRKYLKMITGRGHEVGNHSYYHESWLQTYSFEKIEKEIREAEEAIESVTRQRTIGFRGPGFSWSKDLLEVLQRRNYVFDASILPTYISPLMRMYYFWNSKLSKKERESRKELFGSYKEGFYPVKPFRWNLESGQIQEIPVTTIPVLKIPFHLSYLLYISGYSFWLMQLYLNFALLLCRITRTSPSFLLHPLDLISGDQVPQLLFFPGMNIPTKKKVRVFKYVISRIARKFDVLPMMEFSSRYGKQISKMREISLRSE